MRGEMIENGVVVTVGLKEEERVRRETAARGIFSLSRDQTDERRRLVTSLTDGHC